MRLLVSCVFSAQESETLSRFTSVLSSAARRSRWQEVTRVFADLRRPELAIIPCSKREPMRS